MLARSAVPARSRASSPGERPQARLPNRLRLLLVRLVVVLLVMIRGWRVLRVLALVVGWVAWGEYLRRLAWRSLHMLQLEGYQTLRFLRWSTAKPQRWIRADQALLGLAAAGCAALVQRRRPGWNGLSAVVFTGAGLWLARTSALPTARKPLVLTVRARRLLAGEGVIWASVALGLALGRSRGRQLGLATAFVGAGVASLLAPVVTAAANVLLWPVEEGFRRYYLADAAGRLRLYAPSVIGVAGSYGKTSTKEFIASILGARLAVLRPPGSYNTPMGISRVVREQLTPQHQVFVAELGDYVPGDIALLCDLVRPRIGVLTTLGPEHMERFKTMQRVVASKRELLDALPVDGVAVINQDDPLQRSLADHATTRGLRVVRYGQREAGAAVRATDVQTTRDGLVFRVVADGHGEAVFRVGVLGRHNVANLLAATATALEMGLRLDEIADAVTSITPVEHRLQPISGAGGVLVIDDAFNSNPSGAAEALDVLAELDGGRRMLVTPGMVELAGREYAANRRFGEHAARVCDEVILVGRQQTAPIMDGLVAAEFPAERIHVVADLKGATRALTALLKPGDIVLFENDLPDTYAETDPTQPAPSVGPAPALPKQLPAADQRTLVVNGLTIAYRDSGTSRTPGTAAVVLHGWGADGAVMDSIRRCLAADQRVIVPDLPGFGASDPPPATWGSAEYAALVEALVRQLGIHRVGLVGHSFGGKVCLYLAAAQPELVERLVLVNSAGIRPAHGPRYQARVIAFKGLRRALSAPVLRDSRPAQTWFGSRFGSQDYRQAAGLRTTFVRVVNEDVRALLPRVQAPTLLIWGDRDHDTPLADGELMERLLPDAGLVVFSDAGHFAYADDPQRFCRVVSHFFAASL